MENWSDYIHQRFGDVEGLELVQTPDHAGLRLQPTHRAIGTRIDFVFVPQHPTLAQVMCYATDRDHVGIPELAYELGFTPENVTWLDRALGAVVHSGWREEHYHLFSAKPYKRVPYVGGERWTVHYEGGLGVMADALTLGFFSRLAKRKEVVVDPLLPGNQRSS